MTAADKLAVAHAAMAIDAAVIKVRTAITEHDLYAIGMESPTAWAHMSELCRALNLPYPPQPENRQPNEGLSDPIMGYPGAR